MSGPMVSTRNTLEAKKRKDAAVTKGIHIEESISAKFPARPDVRAFKLIWDSLVALFWVKYDMSPFFPIVPT